jgi:hypothetical protein
VIGDPTRPKGKPPQTATHRSLTTVDEAMLPEQVQETLGHLSGCEGGQCWGCLAPGLGMLRELLERRVDEIVGLTGGWNPAQTAVRHGHETREVTLGAGALC